jgi:iron(III) transport system substrate-binding protein
MCLGLASVASAGELNVYYGTSRDLFEPVIQLFAKAHPDIKVSSYRAPTEELMATIELELRAGKPRADVIVATAAQLAGLQMMHKAFDRVSPKDLAAIKSELRDPELLLTPVAINLNLIQYNNKRISAQDAPKRWRDLLDKKWDNQISITDPRRSSSAHSHIWLITKYLHDKYGEPYGWKFYQELRKLNVKYVSSHGTIRSMAQTGERPLGMQMLNDALKSIAKGEPCWIVFPEEGSAAEVTAAPVLKASRNPKEARAFVDFLLSQKGQELMVDPGGWVPVRTDTAFKFPDGRGLSDIKAIPVDSAYITPEKRQEHMQKFEEIMR